MIINFPLPSQLLPHRSPMLLVEKIIEFEPNLYLASEAFFEKDSYFFKGHFEGQPITPGVILVETMFQTCGLFMRMNLEHSQTQGAILGRAIKIKNATFNNEVSPEQRLKVYAKLKSIIMGFYNFECEVRLDDIIMCTAELVLK
ncbi:MULTISPECIES: 3-hydroxyacyl-ACP dehydratase FabZ family protein [unclassified Chryseobacterium]|uniref:3-hydroxyacyl-ACP dehydratase FabZ family protein n=1 Tax=unclassified Chryseobacterium TaxID=2593645 RepID=UPI000D3788B5|nr:MULTISPECIES: 3-hydroxyacyl-ACP dehydratase FabZ family protein [unclassified Chryseobacterium]PTT40856.1 hypothetical protein DBR28_05105 [Chryseobacterium sp. HMWF028]PTT75372.1 hypothetical protein DBR25_08460 [Chryseobacterium sp. HMWF001]PVV61178.1 beta-hydroxyacyl-ACP dehydratase [Chryseobacterium sp. HMWF035]